MKVLVNNLPEIHDCRDDGESSNDDEHAKPSQKWIQKFSLEFTGKLVNIFTLAIYYLTYKKCDAYFLTNFYWLNPPAREANREVANLNKR